MSWERSHSMSQDLAMLTLKQASDLVARRQVSPLELVDAALERTDRLQPSLNAYITLLADEVRAEAKRLGDRLATGASPGPLAGIPVALKDLYYTRGIRTTAGSKILRDFVPDFDSAVTEHLRQAGAMLMGKTNTHEFAYGPTAEASFFGPVRNPWDTSRITGGSSGGSGAAVAAGLAYMAMGSDTGGSIRIPASLCGVVGFKPTYGLISLYGVVPLSTSFDHAGPLVRSVMDAAMTMDAIAGYDPRDPNSVAQHPAGYAAALAPVTASEKPLKGLVAGVPLGFFWEKVEPEVEAEVRGAIKTLGELGADLREVTIPGLDEVPGITSVIMGAEAACYHRDYLANRADDYQPDVRQRLEAAASVEAWKLVLAIAQRKEALERLACAMKGIDVLVMPTEPVPAYKIGTQTLRIKGNTEPAREMLVRHTRLGNMTGGPALSVPCGLVPPGLPCGLQILGKRLDDIKVLKVGYAYEMARPWEFPAW
jgi:aspartyl-tRNA(Asn)/glutamyl-tRNA(Gln) amidotransferase subunit A